MGSMTVFAEQLNMKRNITANGTTNVKSMKYNNH